MLNITRYDPYGDVFDDFMKGFWVRPVTSSETAETVRRIKIDVTEKNGEYKVMAEIPGVKKEDIHVDIDGDVVSLTAETRAEKEVKEGERVIHSERYFGKVSRSFRLGQEVDEAKATAKYTDGVLELVLPKKVAAASRRLTIQ
ncbi:MAG: heat-shock protein Hsp20 [Betaproteobacteria bacterium RIFCSPLOWO2_12_FULL_63_13]|nr:MAG: heat-shock protein Hsp20 [Betaproteobacteria bacterium RIFCSPLOWO2_12_FULL_63_13]